MFIFIFPVLPTGGAIGGWCLLPRFSVLRAQFGAGPAISGAGCLLPPLPRPGKFWVGPKKAGPSLADNYSAPGLQSLTPGPDFYGKLWLCPGTKQTGALFWAWFPKTVWLFIVHWGGPAFGIRFRCKGPGAPGFSFSGLMRAVLWASYTLFGGLDSGFAPPKNPACWPPGFFAVHFHWGVGC